MKLIDRCGQEVSKMRIREGQFNSRTETRTVSNTATAAKVRMLRKTKDQIILGVLIPTRNREEYLIHAVGSASRFCSACSFTVKIFVANNGDRELSQATVQVLQNSGVSIIELPSEPISMSQNWQRGYEWVQGTDVTHLLVLGDDDLLLSPDYEAFTDAFLNGFDAVICDKSTRHFRWKTPDSPARIRFSRQNSQEMATRMRSNPEDMFTSPNLYTQAPSPYQGFISMEWLREVVAEFGVVSPSRSPDVFLSFALASLPQFASTSLQRSFLADGQSPKSNGASMLGFSNNKLPGEDFKRLSALEISPTTSLPGLEDFPSLFVATTEVYDWVKLKRPHMPDLDMQAVVHGMSIDLPRATSSDAAKLAVFAEANGYSLSSPTSEDEYVHFPTFEFGRRRFSAEARDLTPEQVCEIMSSPHALMKYLWSNRVDFVKSFPANVRRLAGRACVKARRQKPNLFRHTLPE